MKVLLTKTSKLFFLATMMLSLAATTGCDKDDDNTPPAKKYGKIAVLNGAFGVDSINFFIENKKVNAKLIGYSDSLNYVEILAGEPSVEIKGKDDKSLSKKSIKTSESSNYSLLVTNSTDGKTFETIQVTDDLTAPAENKAKIRLVHLSPDVNKLNLETGDTKVFENAAYKAATTYKEINAQKTTFKIVDSESKATLATITDLELSKGKIYTVWLSGLKETADDKKKAQANIFVNK
ncbi:MAG TPA: hypothetical protein DCQ50_09040 [Chryseobacterium sp.]|nr:hypothetical protein [Chryseobacterium sp.]